MSQKPAGEAQKGKLVLSSQDMKKICKLIENIRYGSVTLVIQDGRVVQLDINEKMRLV